ncbi:MAG: ABC transporter substrate-binding protein [Methanomassiliicoccaceae archaeon]|jgi:iron complex transport system substrate-binding protein|nr:ABC transporter substrate-binding protein [Methanomassiliicoccaceae archaeon]
MKKNTAIFIAAVAAIAIAAGGWGFLMLPSDNIHNDDTDGAGRPLAMPKDLSKGIVTIGGADPLRLVSYFNMNDRVIQVDNGDVNDPKNGRAYSYAYDYTGLPHHGDNVLSNADVERIGELNPSLVIVGANVYSNYKNNVEALAKRTSVVVLHNIPTDSMIWDNEYKLNDTFVKQLDMLGKALGKEERAKELREGMNKILSEIRELVSERTAKYGNTYVAGVTYQGSNPLNATFPTYAPLMLIGANNVAHSSHSNSPKVLLTTEQVSNFKMDMVLLDPSSSDKIKVSQDVMKYLSMYDIPIYVTIPIVWDGTNYDCVLACAYYLSHLLYDSISQEEAEKKIVGLFEFFYGTNGTDVLKKMTDFFIDKSKQNDVELPLMKKVKVVEIEGKYSFEEVMS